MSLDPLTLDFWWMLGTAILCGVITGLERELRDKPTGLRTCIMICVGTALFIRTSLLMSGEHGDPTRVLGQVVSGIGFLGGGVILSRGHIVTGVTTASIVWLLAAVGAMIGFNQFSAAVVVSVVMVALLILFEAIEARISPRAKKQPANSDSQTTTTNEQVKE